MQTRFDRDQYIKVHDERVEGGKTNSQYAICPESECPAYGPYECESIMHYEGVIHIFSKIFIVCPIIQFYTLESTFCSYIYYSMSKKW